MQFSGMVLSGGFTYTRPPLSAKAIFGYGSTN